MSVNAINAADPQQKQGSSVGAAISTGVGLGLVGSGAGYFLGGKRPDLEKVFAMPADKFESATKDLKDAEKEAADKLAAGRKELQDAVESKYKEFSAKTHERAAKISAIAPENAELATNATTAESELNAIKVNIGGEEKSLKDVRDAVKNARAQVKAATTDEAKNAAKEELKKALDDYNAFSKDEKAKAAIEKYAKAEHELNTAKVAKYNADAAEGKPYNALEKEISEIRKGYKDAFDTKMNALKENKDYQEAFGKINKLFPKEGKGKAAMIYGSIAAAIGLVAGYFLGNSKEA